MIIKSILSGNINTISILMFLFGALIIAFAKGVKKLISKDKKKTIIYLLVSILVFAFLSIFSFENIVSMQFMHNYIVLQVFSLLAGILHAYALEKIFEWDEKLKWLSQLLFSTIIYVVGCIVFIQIAGRYGIKNLHYFFLTGTFSFLFPWLYARLFNSVVSMPLAIYRKWQYPNDKVYVQPSAQELKNPYLIKIEINKNNQAKNTTRLRVKAPEAMEFGKFFYHFVNDYNQKHPEAILEYVNTDGLPYEWIFYRKPRFLGRWKQINTDLTIARNSIKENQTIICERIVD